MGNDLIPSSDVAPYTLPLGREEYTRALRLGLGRALEHAREFGIAEFIEETADACVHCYEHDAQLNGDRTDWMLEIINAAGADNLIANRIAKTWTPPADGNRHYADENQLSEILCHFAKNGHSKSRDILHRVFRIDDHTSLLIGSFEIIELDGVDGLKTVCNKVASWLDTELDIYFANTPIRHYDQIHGEGKAMEALTEMSGSDPCLAEYLDYLEVNKEPKSEFEDMDNETWDAEFRKKRETTRSELRSTPAEIVIDAIRNEAPNWPRTRLWKWGKEAPDESLQTILNALHEERDPDKLAQYLRVFMHRPIPKIDARLIELADHENDDVRRTFYLALRSIPHPSIRDLAIRCVREGKITEGQLELFKLNGGPGDAGRIARSLYIPDDDWAFHTITSDLSILCEHNPTEEYAGLMLFVYENSNCGFCRMNAVESLLKANAAPDWLLQEVPSCSSEDVRDALNPEAEEDS